MDTHTSETIIIVCALAVSAFTIWLLFQRFQSGSQLRVRRVETFNRLIDRFPSTDDLVSFVSGDPGRALFDDKTVERDVHTPQFRYVRVALLTFGLGAAFLINSLRAASHLSSHADINDLRNVYEMQDIATVFIAIAVSLGLVALTSAWMQRRKSA
jgi:hypothetical protein